MGWYWKGQYKDQVMPSVKSCPELKHDCGVINPDRIEKSGE